MCVVSQLVATEEHLKEIIAEHLKEIILTSCPETPSSCYKDLNEAAGQRDLVCESVSSEGVAVATDGRGGPNTRGKNTSFQNRSLFPFMCAI